VRAWENHTHPDRSRTVGGPVYALGVSTPLGDYLRARRDQVTPEQLRLPSHTQRRVPGLRREEVAFLAGVSADYYVRLEQGRERHPSAQVLDALAEVLVPGDLDARRHLYRLAGLTPSPRVSAPERVDPELLELLSAWPEQPALVLGRAYDVLALNALGRALFGVEAGTNLMELVFLEAPARSFYADWDTVAADSVAGFRLLHGEAPGDPRIGEVLARLLDGSAEFADLWERHEVRGKRLQHKRFRHRWVGDLELRMQVFDVRSAPGQELVVYHAEPGSASADGLRLLGTLAAYSPSAETRSAT
jgi:transcriptional regulator with XRE-family HTH domain